MLKRENRLMARTQTDWPALKLEYVNSTMSLRELAERHGIKSAGVMARAVKDSWDAARKQKQAEVSAAAQERLDGTRIDELAAFNEADIKMARAIRAKAAQMMQQGSNLSPAELRSVAASADTAQKIGRLALGAETARTVNDNRSLPPIKDEDWL